MNVISTYMINIFMKAGSSIDPFLAPILVCVVQQICASLCIPMMKKIPRRTLFFVCATAIGVSQAGLGTYSYFFDDEELTYLGWIPIICVVSVNIFKALGFLVVIQLAIVESFPTEIRFNIIYVNVEFNHLIKLLLEHMRWGS